MKYAAVCFDLDGVIVDSESLHQAAFKAALNNYQLPLTARDYTAYFAGKTDQQGFNDYLSYMQAPINITDLLAIKQQAFISFATDKLTYYKGVVTLIKHLAKVAPLALVTGSSPEETRIILSANDIGRYFSALVTASDVTYSKPNPEGYRLAASLLGESIPPEHCIAIEDSPSGVQAAKQAGMYCIAVTNTHTADLLYAADAIVSQLELGAFTQLMDT